MGEHVYKPGDTVPKSGLFRVSHKDHRPAHEATLFDGEQFPGCANCGDQVRFELLRAAVPILEDEDFRKKRAARRH